MSLEHFRSHYILRKKVTEEKSGEGTSHQLSRLGKSASWPLWGPRAAHLAAGPPDSAPLKGSSESLPFLVLGTREKPELAESLGLLLSPVLALVAVVTKKQGAILFLRAPGLGSMVLRVSLGLWALPGPFRREARLLFLGQRRSRSISSSGGSSADVTGNGQGARHARPPADLGEAGL